MTVDVEVPAVLDELVRALAESPPLGPWVIDAACAGRLDDAEVWVADFPDPDGLASAERACRRCPVRQACADYATRTAVHGLWAGKWHTLRGRAEVPSPCLPSKL